MAPPSPNTTVVFRGATALFTTTFYDGNGNVVQPAGALLNLKYFTSQGQQNNAQVNYVAPAPGMNAWTAQWDSRGAGPGPVFGSVHSISGGIPFAVEDFNFILSANSANVPTF